LNKSIGSIVWPESVDESVRSLLLYMTRVVEKLGVSFDSPNYDPLATVKELLAGRLSEDDRRVALAHWWKVVDERGIRNFESREALLGRLAVCLLSPSKEEKWSLSDQLSWFLEVLGFLGADVDGAIVAMEEHFDFA
jgi:hypothetical protein